MPKIQINGKSLYYTISEPQLEAKATLLVIHGLGSSSSYYFPVIPYLAPNIRCVAIDIAGSGLSELGGSEQSIFSVVDDTISLLDELEIKEKVTVVGHSMGGIVASQMAANHVERVDRVVLIGPIDPNNVLSEIFESRVQIVKRDGIESLATTVPSSATGRLSTALHHSFIRFLILSTSSENYISLCRVIAAAKKPDYAAITVPLLIIAGSDDVIAPMAGCEAIFNSYSTKKEQKRIEILDGIGHWHCIEAGEVVARHIKDFVLGWAALIPGED